jgi:hypothetical protein
MRPQKDWDPKGLIEVSGSYWQACTLHAAVRLDVFGLIGDGKLRAEEIANGGAGSVRGTEMLLNALAAMGLLAKEGALYSNTDASRRFLTKESPQYIGYILMHHHHLVEAWARLPEAVRSGEPTRGRATSDPEARESFLMGMFNMAMAIAPSLTREIDLSGRKHLLDVGGGPGTYAIHFCLANPELKAAVFDLPTTRPFAEKTIQRFRMDERVTFVDGDYVTENIEGRYDVAWLSHILHGEGPETCQRMIHKTVKAMERGGLVMVHEFVMDDSFDGPLFPALFSLNMLVNTEEGKAYSEGEIKGMLAKAGLSQIRRLPFQGPNASGIICGIL